MTESDFTPEQENIRLTDDEKKKYLTQHRKAVRRDFFRRKAILKKVEILLSRPGVFTDGDRFGPDGERSVAGTEQRTPGDQSLPPNNGAKLTISGRKTMHESDDENMGQTDRLSSSSGSDTLSDSGIKTTADQAAQPGQEQKPALTDRKDE